MAEGDKPVVDQQEKLVDMAVRMRRERDERLAALRLKLAEEPVEPDPGLKELVDTQDEFRERIMARIDRMIASARL
jgi:hypothetical protein